MHTTSGVFVASSVGFVVLHLYFTDKRLPTEPSKNAIAARALITLGHAILAGYLAAFVFEVSQPLHAFLLGLGLDSVLVSSRRTARQFYNLATTGALTDLKGVDGQQHH